jgi:hypothetical protein
LTHEVWVTTVTSPLPAVEVKVVGTGLEETSAVDCVSGEVAVVSNVVESSESDESVVVVDAVVVVDVSTVVSSVVDVDEVDSVDMGEDVAAAYISPGKDRQMFPS